MTATRLCIIRHGETHWNTERRLQGFMDTPLNAAGLAQADALPQMLAGERFSAIYSSDMKRTMATAAPVSAAHGLPVQTVEGLRERYFGDFEGLNHDEMRARFPEEYAAFQRWEPDFAPPGGAETMTVFAARLQKALTDIAGRHTGETVLVFTHGGGLDVAYRLSTGLPLHVPRDYPLPNALPAWIEYRRERWTLIRWPEARG
jgi:2,3-bisphosphoglycerate-dependent phosphoglycerate mutase